MNDSFLTSFLTMISSTVTKYWNLLSSFRFGGVSWTTWILSFFALSLVVWIVNSAFERGVSGSVSSLKDRVSKSSGEGKE